MKLLQSLINEIDIDQLEFIERKLRDIALAVEAQFNVEFTVTSLYRIGDNGVPVCGLHCEDNMQLMFVEDNSSKGNSYG